MISDDRMIGIFHLVLADVKTGYKRAGGASLYLRQVLPLQLTRLVVSGIQV